MGNVIFGMMVSLDGFVADRTGSVRRLYPEGSLGANTELEESIATTGAVVMGRRTYQRGEPDSYAESYEFQVPIFVKKNYGGNLNRSKVRLTVAEFFGET